MAYEETTFMLNFSSQGAKLIFIAWKKFFLRFYSHMTSHYQIQIHELSDCLAKGVKILDGMKCSPLFAPIPFDI